MNQHQEFLTLLQLSNELKKKNKSLQKTDPEAFQVFLHFLVRIERNLHYSEKQEYMNLAKYFLENETTPEAAENFSYSFLAIYEGISKKLSQLEKEESPELMNFLKPSRPELGNLLARIYGACDAFSPDPEIAMSDEKELKECAKTLLLKLQDKCFYSSCNFNA